MSASDFQDYDFKPAQQPKSRGCLFYGCVFAGVGAILLGALLGVVGYMAWSYYAGAIAQYTEDKPRTLPAVKLDDEAQKAVARRFKEYGEAVEEGKPLADRTLVLDSDELNALINQNDDIKGKVSVSIEGDKVRGEISMPLGETGLPKTEGRYLNGKATFKVDLRDGHLVVNIDDVEVKGEPLPDSFMQGIRGKNLAEEWEKDQDKDEKIAKTLARLERVEVKDGKLIITAKAPEAPSADAPAPTPEAPKAEPEAPKAAPETAAPARGTP